MLLVALASSVAAFSLLGPFESFQTSQLSYHIGGDIGAPKNIGEEYRLNLPVLYYSYDRSFLDYFGSNGVVAIEQAVSIMSNHLSAPNNSFTILSSNLNEFPRQAGRIYPRAAALQMIDLKTVALNLMVEEFGLAEPDRWTWCLHARIPRPACPSFEYHVIQRNFDPATWQPSKYVNGTLFTYHIEELCPTPDRADAVEDAVSAPFDETTTAVASINSILYGHYSTALSRDDMGGFRYMLRYNNLNMESVDNSATLSGGLVFSTNTAQQQVIYSANLALFAAQALTNTAAGLQTLYPNLIIGSTSNFLVTVISTNATGVATNLAGSMLTITNTSTNILLVTSNLALFAAQGLTNTGVALAALYPGLVVTGDFPFYTNVVTTNVSTALTNYP